MNVTDAVRDTVYATIGFASLTAQSIATQVEKVRVQVEELAKTRPEGAQAKVAEVREQLVTQGQTISNDVTERLQTIAKDLRARTDELNGRYETVVPEQVREGFEQIRTQVTQLATQVRENAQKLVQRPA